MLVSDIILRARRDYLDDMVEDYNWPDETLVGHLDSIQTEFAKETGILVDFTTPAICQIPILANQATYPMDPRITEVHDSDLVNGPSPIPVQNLAWIQKNISRWRTATGMIEALLPDYNLNILRIVRFPDPTEGYWTGAVIFAAATKTITLVGAKFSNTLKLGDQFVVSGTTFNGTAASPKTFTVATVSQDSLTVVEIVFNESSPAILQKIVDTLWLNVSRLPLNPITLAGMEDPVNPQSPEVPAQYHVPALLFGILRESWGKADSQTYDKALSDKYAKLFENEKRKAMAETIWRRSPSEDTMTPRLGSL